MFPDTDLRSPDARSPCGVLSVLDLDVSNLPNPHPPETKTQIKLSFDERMVAGL